MLKTLSKIILFSLFFMTPFVAFSKGGYVLSNDNGSVDFAAIGITNLTLSGTITGTSTTSFSWTVQAASNQACNTTCTSACVFGFDRGTLAVVLASIVDCADASADQCLCAGSS